mmetsp:Transcript_27892/g.40782  ORF Transcript_27892/g.40782 Transcript_27892/m.40782 type:complete len:363 (-) Transcript_27892:296-1384(-)
MRKLLALQKKEPPPPPPQKKQQQQKADETKNQEKKNKNQHSNENNKKKQQKHENDKEDDSKQLLQTLSFSSLPTAASAASSKKEKTSSSKSSALRKAFMERLAGSRFRELNEELYTTHSSTAYHKFTEQPELFQQYHDGFKQQVLSWPTNPVDVMLRSIVAYQKQQQQKKKIIVADFGCGEAKLAEKLLSIREVSSSAKQKKKKKQHNKNDTDSSSYCPFEVHSFDLVSGGNPLITPCDMSNVPLETNTVDVAVFCLALMGTNIDDFIREAHRVLKKGNGGILKIAEVRSRFESTTTDSSADNSSGSGGLDEFLQVMKTLGFDCTRMNRSNKMFLMMDFVKNGDEPSKQARFTAKPCIYKRR